MCLSLFLSVFLLYLSISMCLSSSISVFSPLSFYQCMCLALSLNLFFPFTVSIFQSLSLTVRLCLFRSVAISHCLFLSPSLTLWMPQTICIFLCFSLSSVISIYVCLSLYQTPSAVQWVKSLICNQCGLSGLKCLGFETWTLIVWVKTLDSFCRMIYLIYESSTGSSKERWLGNVCDIIWVCLVLLWIFTIAFCFHDIHPIISLIQMIIDNINAKSILVKDVWLKSESAL